MIKDHTIGNANFNKVSVTWVRENVFETILRVTLDIIVTESPSCIGVSREGTQKYLGFAKYDSVTYGWAC